MFILTHTGVYVCMFNKIIITFLFSVKLLYMKRHKTSVYVSHMCAIYEGKKRGNCARVHEHGAAAMCAHTYTHTHTHTHTHQIRRDQYRYGGIGAASHGAIVYG